MKKYKDSSLPVEERVRDLMERMSFEQKIDQITCLVTITPDVPNFKDYIPNGIGHVGAFTTAENVEKIVEYANTLQHYLTEETELGIPALIHCEASAGAQFTEADVFPSAIAQASTFDSDIVAKMAEVIRSRCMKSDFGGTLSGCGYCKRSSLGKDNRDVRRGSYTDGRNECGLCEGTADR